MCTMAAGSGGEGREGVETKGSRRALGMFFFNSFTFTVLNYLLLL